MWSAKAKKRQSPIRWRWIFAYFVISNILCDGYSSNQCSLETNIIWETIPPIKRSPGWYHSYKTGKGSATKQFSISTLITGNIRRKNMSSEQRVQVCWIFKNGLVQVHFWEKCIYLNLNFNRRINKCFNTNSSVSWLTVTTDSRNWIVLFLSSYFQDPHREVEILSYFILAFCFSIYIFFA